MLHCAAVRHARPDKRRPPLFAIAALCLALLGLALPRFDGAAGDADRAESASERVHAGDSAAFAAPAASAVDDFAVLQRASDAMQRPAPEVDWSKLRPLLTQARQDAQRRLVAGDPVRVAEREVAAQASPLLRWRLAHSTSSAIG